MQKDEILTGLARRLQELRTALQQEDIALLAQRCGAELINGRLHLRFWNRNIIVDPENYIATNRENGQEIDHLSQALIAYYLHTCDGTVEAGRWLAMTELPDGRFYTRAFQSYTGRELAAVFGTNLNAFSQAARGLEGTPFPFADTAYRFSVLPHLTLLAACWQGDEEFPPSYTVLFDAHAHHQLPTDGCAILGSTITRRLIEFAYAQAIILK